MSDTAGFDSLFGMPQTNELDTVDSLVVAPTEPLVISDRPVLELVDIHQIY